ncbi:MAG: helix-hairpin-helix domain-containing protein [Phycisphaerales bacterium]
MAVNQALAQKFLEISQMLELTGADSFRASAHARAARNIADLSFDLAPLATDKKKLLEIEGIGNRIADKIIEFVQTGAMKEWTELKEKVPPTLLELLRIPGMGPKTAKAIWDTCGVVDVQSLKRAIEDGSIMNVPRMGEKAVEKIKAALATMTADSPRLWIGRATPIAERIVAELERVPGVQKAAYAGSLRRGRDTVGDLDFLVACKDPAIVSERFRSLPGVASVLAAGETKSSVRLKVAAGDAHRGGLTIPEVQADLRVIPLESWGAALLYFTGSKDHNVALRGRALDKGWTLNEWGLFKLPANAPSKGKAGKSAPMPEAPAHAPRTRRGDVEQLIASATEEELYKALGLPWLPPEIRENRGEFALTETPRLIETADIKAELHAHTTASDGTLEIEELAREAKRRGLHTIAVTDHSKSSAFAGGLQPEALLAHAERVRSFNGKIKGITLLAGSEVDIHADGTLDYEDAVLKELDIVVASPHAALTQDPDKATARLVRAMSNPFVHILGHPTGRLINRRAGTSPDMQKVAAAAKEHNVALEINAHWHRLDLRDSHARIAVDGGCLLAINTDAHTREDFDNLRYGVLTARRAWARPEGCLNAWPAKRLGDWLKSKR